MAESKYFFLSERKRFVNYPFRLVEIGWLPGHTFYHNNAKLKGVYICMSCKKRESSSSIVNGEFVYHKYNPDEGISFTLLLPGTHMHTLKPSIHDELYFMFDIPSTQAVVDLVGRYQKFYFNGWPKEQMIELNDLLHKLDTPGVADKVDQLAVKIITEIIIKHIEQSERSSDSLEMRIYSCANALEDGKPLRLVAKENGFSLRTFYREWNKIFDVTPKDYAINKRVEKSCSLLKNTNLSNLEIASECGFGDVKQFYLWFKKKTGKTPSEYKRLHTKDEVDLSS
ncbi:MAG: helix-turn-helix transcriptional regulator [Lentisphaeria bacterium]|nr:helix-turn-helix transcriptional regulator [Lentisphaerota bacterium]MBR2632661.1 helix-turn-helix transcriptional regulator [Lentisphaeria bacterium]